MTGTYCTSPILLVVTEEGHEMQQGPTQRFPSRDVPRSYIFDVRLKRGRLSRGLESAAILWDGSNREQDTRI